MAANPEGAVGQSFAGQDPNQYRFVTAGTNRFDDKGRPLGSYFTNTTDPNTIADPMSGISIDDFAKMGLGGEAPWTAHANNSAFSDFIGNVKGFFTDTGGAGALIATPFLAAGASELLGAAGVTSPTATGALTGATRAALSGGNPFTGAVTGGVGGSVFGGNADWAQNAINDGSLPATPSGGDFTAPSVPAQMPALDSSGNLLNPIPATPSQLPSLDSSGNVISAPGTITSPAPDGTSSTDQQLPVASPQQSFSNMLHDPNVAAPLNTFAPQSAAQVQTAEMARLDPPVGPEGSYFGSVYGNGGMYSAYDTGENQDVTNPDFYSGVGDKNPQPLPDQRVYPEGTLTDATTGQPIKPDTAPDAAAAPPGEKNGFTDFLKANKGLLLPGAALAASALKGKSTPAPENTPSGSNLTNIASGLNTNAANINATANSLIPSVTTGVLPPGADAMVNDALRGAQSSIRSKYASMGLSGSTMEAQELSSAAQSAASQRFQMANTLTNTGLNAAGISSNEMNSSARIYEAIMREQLAQDSALQNALANFAASAAQGAGSSFVKSLVGS